jgi:hypothetical protein
MKTRQPSTKRTSRGPHGSTNASHAAIVEEVLLQPWFLPQRIAVAIHSLVPTDFWNKMRHFFDDYGCIVCEKEFDYHSNGMCKRCYDRTRKKLFLSVRRHAGRGKKLRLDLELFRQEKLAKKLLARFSAQSPPVPKKADFQLIDRDNPVYATFAGRFE